ncbi:hypothetical protein J6P59_05095 [bacterium]|nr:hypothetical protein [bacterium]
MFKSVLSNQSTSFIKIKPSYLFDNTKVQYLLKSLFFFMKLTSLLNKSWCCCTLLSNNGSEISINVS